jgi:hypothetical protein
MPAETSEPIHPEYETVFATAELLDRVMADDDANDPTLESYQTITN